MMFRVLSIGLMAIWFLVGVSGTQVFAQTDEECMFCHAEPDLTKESVSGEITSQYLDHTIFAESVHAENGCVSCHADIEELPHAENLAPADCGGCHDEVDEYVKSLHGVALKNGDKDAAICHDCHSKHDIRPVSDLLSPVHPRNLPGTCGRCHSDSALVKRHMVSVQKPSDAYIKSVHGKAVTLKGLETAAVCNDCHGTHDMLPSQDPSSRVFWLNIPQTCGQCHAGVVRTYTESIHGRALAAGIKDAPNCTSCHGEHDIESHLLDSSSVSLQQISRSTCTRCHEDETVMKRYGIEVHRQASYMDSYHGVTSTGGAEIVANCTSCHGVHDILPRDDPQSSIHPDNLAQTCGQCHEGANWNFAAGPVHIVPTAPGQWVLGLVRVVYLWAIGLIVGFMVVHNAMLLGRHMLTKLRAELPGPETHERFSLGLRLGHLILALSFIVLALSGFALRHPDAWWVRFVFIGDMGIEFRSSIHRGAGLVLLVITLANIAYMLSTKRGRGHLRAFLPLWKDAKDLVGNLMYAAGLKKAAPRFDRYSYKEKIEYWGLLWGSILMIVTGFCMWYPDEFMTYFPKIALDVVALIHYFEAWLAMLTIVLWHLYFVIIDPEAYPMNWSWLTGHVTMGTFRYEHRGEFDREGAEKESGGASG